MYDKSITFSVKHYITKIALKHIQYESKKLHPNLIYHISFPIRQITYHLALPESRISSANNGMKLVFVASMYET